MLGWLVVTEKLVARPVVAQTTPPEPVKPGSPLHAPEALYVLLSTKYASWAVAALRASAATRALKPRERYAENCGIAIAARMPMMATTTSNSINVKPLDRLRPAFCECMDSSSFWGAVGGPGFTPVCTRRPGRKSRIRGAHAAGPSGHPAPPPAVPLRRRPIRRTFLAVTRFGGPPPLNACLAPAAPRRSGRGCGGAASGRGRVPAPPASGGRRPPPPPPGCS